jgi:hypothetical protein
MRPPALSRRAVRMRGTGWLRDARTFRSPKLEQAGRPVGPHPQVVFVLHMAEFGNWNWPISLRWPTVHLPYFDLAPVEKIPCCTSSESHLGVDDGLRLIGTAVQNPGHFPQP